LQSDLLLAVRVEVEASMAEWGLLYCTAFLTNFEA